VPEREQHSGDPSADQVKVVIVTEEDTFYLPPAVDRLLKGLTPRVRAVVIAENPLQGSLCKAAIRALRAFGLMAVLSHRMRLLKAKIEDIWALITGRLSSHSVTATCAKHRIPVLHTNDVNAPEFLNNIRDLSADLIICLSATQVFKQALLELPRLGCINVHSSLLPKYRGLYPCFWAMAKGETQTGVSVHRMVPEIDLGDVIKQEALSIYPGETLDALMKRAKETAVELLVEAVKEIETDTVVALSISREKGSYYGWPTAEAYRQFIARGHRLW